MMTGFRLNLAPLKEPLGFIKLVEWLTAIFAFGSCGGYSGKNIVSLFCSEGRNETLNATFSYPFRLNLVALVDGDSASSVKFFVGVAIVCFLYAMIALLIYLGYMHVYKDSDFGPMFDFGLTATIAFLWLVCSSAWAKGLQNVKDAVGTKGIISTLALCQRNDIICEVTDFASMRALNVSVVFGYLNLLVWAGNAWFVYKETRWHSQKYAAQHGSQAGRGQHVPPLI
ncbi:hypothetical protein UPYG_G00343810 [Umbra pygmaea]|uniref:MARVEL domain-containing protein n=1 Tax=Umbra pygmaea TaxID=75934 RepID=A0ABD0VXK8_UMBPY